MGGQSIELRKTYRKVKFIHAVSSCQCLGGGVARFVTGWNLSRYGAQGSGERSICLRERTAHRATFSLLAVSMVLWKARSRQERDRVDNAVASSGIGSRNAGLIVALHPLQGNLHISQHGEKCGHQGSTRLQGFFHSQPIDHSVPSR